MQVRVQSSGVDLLEQPCHVLAEGLHGSQALFVVLDFAFGPADTPFTPKSAKRTEGPDILACPLDLPDRTSYNRG